MHAAYGASLSRSCVILCHRSAVRRLETITCRLSRLARNLTDAVDGFLRGKWKLIHDRDPLFSAGFGATLGPT
jgi:hypothetical protein